MKVTQHVALHLEMTSKSNFPLSFANLNLIYIRQIKMVVQPLQLSLNIFVNVAQNLYGPTFMKVWL